MVAVLLAAGMVWAAGTPDHGLAADAVITASSTAVGSAVRDAVDTGATDAPGAAWRSDGHPVGSWLDLAWAQPVTIDHVDIVGSAPGDLQITAGVLDFSDGSRVQVPMSTTDRTTSVTFPARTVQGMRLTIGAVGPMATAAVVAEIVVSATESSPARDPGPESGSSAEPVAPHVPLDPDVVVTGRDGEAGRPTTDWAVGGPGSWIELRWDRPVELTAVRVVGLAGSPAAMTRGRLTIGPAANGPTAPASTDLTLGAVLNDPGRPTTLAFAPLPTRSVRLTVDQADGAGPVRFGLVAAYPRGSTPLAADAAPPPAPSAPLATGTPISPPKPQCDESAAPPTGSRRLVVSCPLNAADVGGIARLELLGTPDIRTVTAQIWPADGTLAAVLVPPVSMSGAGRGYVDLDLSGLPPGPLTVQLVPSVDEGAGEPVLLQLVHRSAGPESGDEDRSPGFVTGRTLAYEEEFDRPLTFSRDGIGADYASAKPTDKGPAAFGDAILPADPSRTMRVADGNLDLSVAPTAPGEADPSGWGRNHLGALLSSARVGGSGFAAQYGYFEARLLAPAAPGTWPAFWMLPSDNLLNPTPVVAEVDAVELYGHAPTGSCHTTKRYPAVADGITPDCRPRFDSIRSAMTWHTWGADVTPAGVTFYLDGIPTSSNRRVDGLAAPMFFLIDLQLGGGWPVDLAATGQRATLWVDRVRVWV